MITVKGQLTDQLREIKDPISPLLNNFGNLTTPCLAENPE